MIDITKKAPILVTDSHMVSPQNVTIQVICRNQDLTLGMVLHALHEIQKGLVTQAKNENPLLNDTQLLQCVLWKGPKWADVNEVDLAQMPKEHD